MAKTNEKGYFCDQPCGFRNPNCRLFFAAGCASAGMRLQPNTEYPEVKMIKVEDVSKKLEKEISDESGLRGEETI